MRNKNKNPTEVDSLSRIKKNKIDNLNNVGEDDGVSTSTTTTTKDSELPGTKTDESDNKNNPEKFFTFTFYKVDPKWRWLNEMGKDEASREFLELLNAARKKIKIRTYSTIGLRHDSEFMIWTMSPSLENIQVLASKIYTTILGKYIEPTSTYLSLTRKSFYSNQVKLGFETEEEPLRYAVVYPFIKSREWYLLPFEKRKEMMEEHIRVGRKYPEIRLNTTYSFGIDDQDFMLAFETDNLSRFQSLIIDLRETQVSKYIIKDTPMIPCVLKNIEEIIKSLG
ncbi:Chlorite dismutase precursor [Candidatus Nitrosocosmicus oleophilus]|jgi:chlorite dismutase|uniref:Chlorite dismutase n=1 Tax=Candidatus Nitrosocosmicus oleophilus TaxID=1353260 RepID=A0A654LUB1_9ARCH|nr:chlorite dismutase family protein [Candidatus Nitrosocosmicus oleophilus]ALI34775.1 Chlorite dismutase precursor [Candidatus Nitrosocosmicus oleophilus]